MPPAAGFRAHEPASNEQRHELRELLETRDIDAPWRKRFYESVRAAGDLTRAAADDALFYARACAPKGEEPGRAIPEQVDALRELIRTRIVSDPLATVFRTRAESQQLTYIEADRWIREWLGLRLKTFVLASDLPRRSGWAAPDGYFGLMHVDGHARCYRVHALPATHKVIVEQITGDASTQRRKLAGYQATEALQAIAADPAGAAVLFARTRKRCSRCNQPIEDRPGEPGWEHGYGRDCWDIMQPPAESEAHA